MDKIKNVMEIIKKFFGDINLQIKKFIGFDEKVIGLYNQIISPLSEWVKILGLIGLLIVLAFGVIAIIKKAYKIVIVVGVIMIVLILLSLI